MDPGIFTHKEKGRGGGGALLYNLWRRLSRSEFHPQKTLNFAKRYSGADTGCAPSLNPPLAIRSGNSCNFSFFKSVNNKGRQRKYTCTKPRLTSRSAYAGMSQGGTWWSSPGFTFTGTLDGGPQCCMPNLRKGNVLFAIFISVLGEGH